MVRSVTNNACVNLLRSHQLK